MEKGGEEEVLMEFILILRRLIFKCIPRCRLAAPVVQIYMLAAAASATP
jgi:hypothetical protein